MTIIAGWVSPSVGTKTLHLNGVSPKLLWPIPYCSTTGVAQARLDGGSAVRVGIKVSVVMTAITTEAIRLRYTNLFFMDFMFYFYCRRLSSMSFMDAKLDVRNGLRPADYDSQTYSG